MTKQSAASCAAISHRLLLQEAWTVSLERGFPDRSGSREDYPYDVQGMVVISPAAPRERAAKIIVQIVPILRDKGTRA